MDLQITDYKNDLEKYVSLDMQKKLANVLKNKKGNTNIN